MASFYILSSWTSFEGEQVIGLWDDLLMAGKWVEDHPGIKLQPQRHQGVWQYERFLRDGSSAESGYYIREVPLNQPLPGMEG